ncbi:hypothetical protein R3P38DRAFT_2586708, partial [Favolaschia claudopus]
FQIIRNKNLQLIDEIGSGPGYFMHTGKCKGQSVIVKVFNAGVGARKYLEDTVELTQQLLHPNLLRITGISSPLSLNQFIAYEHVYWKDAKGPLARALKDDLLRSFGLGLRMVCLLVAAINYLAVQSLSLLLMQTTNFDVFLDIEDRFVVSINPSQSQPTSCTMMEVDDRPWGIFNDLCCQVLTAANHVLHEHIFERNPSLLDTLDSLSQNLSSSCGPSLVTSNSRLDFNNTQSNEFQPPGSLRREYVWRIVQYKQQSLATIAAQMKKDYEFRALTPQRLEWANASQVHRCAGYIREEVTLASSLADSAVVTHNAPSPMEICPVCNQPVSIDEKFRCSCGELTPGSGSTVKCQRCNFWSHTQCVGCSHEFICEFCESTIVDAIDHSDLQGILGAPPSFPPPMSGIGSTPVLNVPEDDSNQVQRASLSAPQNKPVHSQPSMVRVSSNIMCSEHVKQITKQDARKFTHGAGNLCRWRQ